MSDDSNSNASHDPVDPAALGIQLTRLIDGFVITQLIYVVAKLGVVDALSDGARTGEEIAEAVGARADPLKRIMRGLVTEGVFAETGDGRFGLTPLGEALRGLRGAALNRGELYYHSAESLLEAVLEGGIPFERSYGASFFDHLHANPEQEALFQASMGARAEIEAQAVVDVYDFTGLTSLVDVGGGQGVLLGAILRATAGLTGTLLDLAAAMPGAQAYLEALGLGSRVRCVAGDFFSELPPGADAYLLSRVLHDWDDADVQRILTVCREAMRPDSRLLIVDAVLPENANDKPAAIRMDLHMLLLLGARERTEAEFAGLLERCGLRLARTSMTDSPAGLAVIEAQRSD